MKVGVGSMNQTKVSAVAELLRDYPLFAGAEVSGVAVQIEEFGHPKSLHETVLGAIDRAKQAQAGKDFGFGIEGGLMEVPETKSGYMEVAVCAIYDGTNIHLGMSPALEWPTKVTSMILNEGMDGSQAFKAANITDHDKIGTANGFIHIVTNGRMSRTEFNRYAVQMALVHLEHPELYP